MKQFNLTPPISLEARKNERPRKDINETSEARGPDYTFYTLTFQELAWSPRVPKMKQFNLTPLISLVGRKNKRLRKYINWSSYIKISVSYLAFSCALALLLRPPPAALPPHSARRRSAGACEKDIGPAGLDYSMERTARNIMNTAMEHNLGLDLRTAAYINSVSKIFNTLRTSGVAF